MMSSIALECNSESQSQYVLHQKLNLCVFLECIEIYWHVLAFPIYIKWKLSSFITSWGGRADFYAGYHHYIFFHIDSYKFYIIIIIIIILLQILIFYLSVSGWLFNSLFLLGFQSYTIVCFKRDIFYSSNPKIFLILPLLIFTSL